MTGSRRRKLTVRLKVWVELSGQPVLGDGKAMLLEQIDRCGSLQAAAEALGMSYRSLWGRVRQMERRLGTKLLARRTGGRGGGGSELTAAARGLLGRYRRFRRGLDELVEQRFARAFDR
jgi:molybdate transport system regulatory protein